MLSKKELKAEYDRKYRLLNKEKLQQKKREYNKSKAGREMQKRQREKTKLSGYRNEYCKKPEQREKEKHRRHIRENKLIDKFCIVCDSTKKIIDFEFWDISPDNRSYICKECEKQHQELYGCKTRNVVTAMVMRPYTNLTRRDIIIHPYLIEANKYLILLKKLVQ